MSSSGLPRSIQTATTVKGRNPSLASIYRALADHKRRQAYPEAVEQARAEFAT